MVTLKSCPICNKQFKARRDSQKYCSISCRGLHDRQFIDAFCDSCNTPIRIKKCRNETFNHHFCSRECASKGRKELVGINNHRYKGGTRRLPTICTICGNEFLSRISRPQKFCSKQCHGIWMSEYLMGSANPAYAGGISHPNRGQNWNKQRKAALKRDGHCCQICGKSRAKHRLIDVHHIKPFREFHGDYLTANRLSNLITLCRRCHARVEFGKLACPIPLPL